MDSLTIKLDESMSKDIDRVVREHRYGTKTELVREALREKLTKIEKEEAIAALMKFKGSLKRNVTDADLRRTREEVSKKYMKEHGLK